MVDCARWLRRTLGLDWAWARATAAALILAWASVAAAHPVPLAKATLTIDPAGSYQLELHFDLAAYVMQSTPGHLDPELAQELRAMPAADLAGLVTDARRSLAERLVVSFDGRPSAPASIELPDANTLQTGFAQREGPIDFTARLSGPVPEGARQATVTFPAAVAAVALSVVRTDGQAVRQLVGEGQTSTPVNLTGDAVSVSGAGGWWSAAREFTLLGFEHILPYGLDHILFVLGLFLLSPRWKPLLAQVTAFTVAHSITLILSSYQIISLSDAVVEPLIALSITLIAIENLLTTRLTPWRPVVVFVFGLLHGLGFAGVLRETGLPQGQLLTALLAFNVGVELGQLAVIGLALVTIGWWRGRPWYRSRVTIPASCLIAAVGLYWTIERFWSLQQ